MIRVDVSLLLLVAAHVEPSLKLETSPGVGSIDHIAWKASGAAEFRKRLKRLGIEFEEQNIQDAGYQVFLYDPVGTKLEFNIQNEFVPDPVPLGTTAEATMR